MRLIDWDNVLEWMHRQKETTEQWSMRIAIENYVDDMPTVDAEPVRHGRWQKERNPMMYQIVPYVYVCSQCGTAFEYETPYCGECGAKMDEVEDADK